MFPREVLVMKCVLYFYSQEKSQCQYLFLAYLAFVIIYEGLNIEQKIFGHTACPNVYNFHFFYMSNSPRAKF